MGLFGNLFKKGTPAVKMEGDFKLKLGQRVKYVGDFTVAAILTYYREGHTWQNYRLDADDEVFWVSVQQGDSGLALVAWVADVDREGELVDGGNAMMFRGKRFELVEQSYAVVREIEGDVDCKIGDRMEYAAFKAQGDGQAYVIESWPTGEEASYGVPLSTLLFTVF